MAAPDQPAIRQLAIELSDMIKKRQLLGMTDLEVAAALGILIGSVVPLPADRRRLFDFANRHTGVFTTFNQQ